MPAVSVVSVLKDDSFSVPFFNESFGWLWVGDNGVLLFLFSFMTTGDYMMGSAFSKYHRDSVLGLFVSFFLCDKQRSLRRDWVDIVMSLSSYVH